MSSFREKANIVISDELMRSLPLPTIDQHQRFVKHLKDVHSWYKHLPLLTGGVFVVFLAPDAGTDYPTEHPRLPFGNSVEGYRQAFGHLDYMWQIETESFHRDGAEPAVLPDEFVQEFSFVLYPYVAGEFYWSIHEEAVTELHQGKAQHPAKELILELATVDDQLEQAQQKITYEEWKMLVYEDEQTSVELTPEQREFLVLFRKSRKLYKQLQTQEVEKIEQQLNCLYKWYSA